MQWVVALQGTTFGQHNLGKLLPFVMLRSQFDDLVSQCCWQADRSIVIGHDDVAGDDGDATAGDGAIEIKRHKASLRVEIWREAADP